jgi:hypothetical protein
MARGIVIKRFSVNADGSVLIDYSSGTPPVADGAPDTQLKGVAFADREAIKALYEELDDKLETDLILMCVALYSRESGDDGLMIAESGLVGKSIALDLSNLTEPLAYS